MPLLTRDTGNKLKSLKGVKFSGVKFALSNQPPSRLQSHFLTEEFFMVNASGALYTF